MVGANGASLKPGKFENGFIVRMRNYHDHLRREDEGGEVEHVFQECLQLALVLDLSTVRLGLPSAARVFEHYWNESVSAFLEEEILLVGTQNGRAEWRSVTAWSERKQARHHRAAWRRAFSPLRLRKGPDVQ